MTKSSVFILNCCPLGENEVEFWNALFDRYCDRYKFHFFTTNIREGLRADEIIQVVYEASLYEELPSTLSNQMLSIVDRIAEKDLIWEAFDIHRSRNLAYSWLMFWTVALKTFSPVRVVIWNGHHIPEAALAQACALVGVRKLFAERGPFAGTFALDEQGVNCHSRFFSNYDQVSCSRNQAAINKFVDLYLSRGSSNWNQPARKTPNQFKKELGVPSDKTLLFFPSQVDRDTNSKLFSPHFASSNDALCSVIEWCNIHAEQIFLLVKKHPLQDRPLPNVEIRSGCYVESVHIFDCIENSDGIVSVNSSSATEAALLGKPILLLGDSILDYCEGVHKLKSRSQLSSELSGFVRDIRFGHAVKPEFFFPKLLFSYLCAASEELIELGIPEPDLGLELLERSRRLTNASEDLFYEVSSLELLIPSPNNVLTELKRCKLDLRDALERGQQLRNELEHIRAKPIVRLYRRAKNLFRKGSADS